MIFVSRSGLPASPMRGEEVVLFLYREVGGRIYLLLMLPIHLAFFAMLLLVGFLVNHNCYQELEELVLEKKPPQELEELVLEKKPP